MRKHESGTSGSDSDESTAGYWLRVPVKEVRCDRGDTDHYLPVETQWGPVSERENRHVQVSDREEMYVNTLVNGNESQRDSQPAVN